ncbi:MAG: hypothetical protein ABR915_11185 [Thermoguttaceae bacterium]|jgi:hypothetical protein
MGKKTKEQPVAEPLAQTAAPEPVAPAETVVRVNHRWTSDGRVKGLRCPKCWCIQFREGKSVRNTVPVEGAVKRYRVCRNCGTAWTTLELPEALAAR